MMQESFNDKNSRKNNNRYGKGKKFQKNNVKQSRNARRKQNLKNRKTICGSLPKLTQDSTLKNEIFLGSCDREFVENNRFIGLSLRGLRITEDIKYIMIEKNTVISETFYGIDDWILKKLLEPFIDEQITYEQEPKDVDLISLFKSNKVNFFITNMLLPLYLQGKISDIKVQNGEISTRVTENSFCIVLEHAYNIRNINPKRWLELADDYYEFKYTDMYENIIKAFVNDDKSKLIEYIQYRNSFANFKIDDIKQHKTNEFDVANKLILQEEVENIIKNYDSYYNLALYEDFQEYIITVSDKLLDIIREKLGYNLKPSQILEIIVCCREILDTYSDIKFIEDSRYGLCNEGTVENIVGLNEWKDFNRAVLFRVLNELLKPNTQQNFDEFKELALSFVRENYKLYRIPNEWGSKMYCQVLNSFRFFKSDLKEFVTTLERLNNLTKCVEKLKNNHWILDYKYRVCKNNDLVIPGQVELIVASKNNGKFAVTYDGRLKTHTFLFDDTNSRTRFLGIDTNKLLFDIKEFYNTTGFSMNATNDVFVTQIDRDIKKQDAICKELSSLGLNLAMKVKNFLSLVDKNYPCIFDDISDLEKIQFILNEDSDDKQLTLIAPKEFFLRKLEMLYYNTDARINENLISDLNNIYEFNDDAYLAVNIRLSELTDTNDGICEITSAHDNTHLITEEEKYKNMIYEYIISTEGESKNLFSIEWLDDFFKPLGKLYTEEAKGDHFKLRLVTEQGVTNFWTISLYMIRNGIYKNNIPLIIGAFGLSNKEVYEKCIKDRIDNKK